MKKIILLLMLALLLPATAWADRDSRTTPLVRAVQEAAPAVVSISTIRQDNNTRSFSTGDPMLDELFNNMFPPRRSQRGSLGTGMVVDGQKGIIVTNSHVVRGATEITVQLNDRREFSARLLGQDPDNDIAVLMVDSQLPQARLGDSDDIMIGEQVIAIGNPYGFSHTVTVGVVSALHRRIKTGPDSYLSDLVQTDASINPGNSGGPLLNVDGEIIGINTMIHRSAQGIGFAIPINKVVKVAEILSSPQQPVWLGVLLEDSEVKDAAINQEFCLSVSQLSQNSPAAKASLRHGDVLLAIDDWPLLSLPDYSLALRSMRPGQQVTLKLYRQGRGLFTEQISAEKFDLIEARELFRLRTGITLNSNPQPGGGFKISKADVAGIKPGDLVMAVGEHNIKTSQDLIDAMLRQQGGGQMKVMLRRGNMMRMLAF